MTQLKLFFAHTDHRMRMMADLLRQGRDACEVTMLFPKEVANTGRSGPCLCGSGKKYKACCAS